MYRMSGFAEKYNVQICENSTRNCVCYMYGMLGLAEKLHILICINSTGNCVHYMYGMSGFAEKLNVQIWKIRWEIVYIFCTEFPDLQKNWISQTQKIQRKIVYITYVRNVWICRKFECPELQKFNGKFCTFYERNV